MNKEFIPYTQALALKELGFDEPCMAIYYSKDKSFSWHHHKDHTNNEPTLDSGEFNISAPLCQQAFRWFREKYGNFYDILQFHGGLWGYSIYGQVGFEAIFVHSKFNTYEEAELACLKKLIEIVK